MRDHEGGASCTPFAAETQLVAHQGFIIQQVRRLLPREGRKGVGGGSSTIVVNVNLLANLSSRTQFSLCSEVCSVNISTL
jgi:hypothetical protein